MVEQKTACASCSHVEWPEDGRSITDAKCLAPIGTVRAFDHWSGFDRTVPNYCIYINKGNCQFFRSHFQVAIEESPNG